MGWAVLDVLYHQLMDARRALVTFASPAPDPPDTELRDLLAALLPGQQPSRGPGKQRRGLGSGGVGAVRGVT